MRDSNESALSRVFEGAATPPPLRGGWPAHSSPATTQSELAAAAAASLDLPLDCPLADLGSSAGLLLECQDALLASAAGEADCPIAGHEIHDLQVECVQAGLGSSSGLPVLHNPLQQVGHQTTECLAAGQEHTDLLLDCLLGRLGGQIEATAGAIERLVDCMPL